MNLAVAALTPEEGERYVIRGQVQGVGFRPAVWRVATELGLTGHVRNTADGVEICLWGDCGQVFADRLMNALPPLARIDRVTRAPIAGPAPDDFSIALSTGGAPRAAVTPDLAVCSACMAEIADPFERRYRYPFANCTDCGPRFSIVEAVPYDRSATTMRAFEMCRACRAEYDSPADRRFHAQPVACHDCGPKAWIARLGGGAVSHDAFSMLDAVDAAGGMILKGFIVAGKGIGGYHLACDATNEAAMKTLRARKRRPGKAFALMARDLDVIRDYAVVSETEIALLKAPQAPIVLLDRVLKPGAVPLADAVAPGLAQLGFMLPYTPLHHLMLRRVGRPVAMTSANLTCEPQIVDDDAAQARLVGIADFILAHDRRIANRIDDSVMRVDRGVPRFLRRARGFAPSALPLPEGFDADMQVLAMGSELKNTFCLVKNGEAVLSQHMGDLKDAATAADAAHNLKLYRALYDHKPVAVAVDRHPEYLSTKAGYEIAGDRPVVEIQHHHAHIAACLAENGRPFGATPVLGVALDGLGFGDDGTLWGGEFLLADYCGYRRVGCFKPVALPGGAAAARAPWRNAYAHLMAEMGWAEFAMNFAELDLHQRLSAVPRATLDGMIAAGINTPLSSSCGRLFDAAAAMTGLAWEAQDYEGEAAMRFEAAIDPTALEEPDDLAYPFAIPLLGGAGLPYIEPLGAWRALLGDLILGTPVSTISARFHRGLACAVVALAHKCALKAEVDTVALSGGCFQNRTLFALVHDGLAAAGLNVLSHSKAPANDGGLALGQAVVALAVLRRNAA